MWDATNLLFAVLLVSLIVVLTSLVAPALSTTATPPKSQCKDVTLSNFGEKYVGNDFCQEIYARRGNDIILGDTGVGLGDWIFLGRGSDTSQGGGGNDFISGGPGRDGLGGGSGNDVIGADDGEIDNINCGKGLRDLVYRDRHEGYVRNCERQVIDGILSREGSK